MAPMVSPAEEDAVRCYGRLVPPFCRAVFPKVLRAGVDVMAAEQIEAVAAALSPADRLTLSDALGPEGVARLLQDLPAAKAERLARCYQPRGQADEPAFRAAYPRLAAATNGTLSLEQLVRVLGQLSAEEMASQSFCLGGAGRAAALTALSPDRIAAILDHTDDWVMLATSKRALAEIDGYTATVEKQERIDGKLGAPEVIALKVRHAPAALHLRYLRWLAGPHKGRQLLYNPQCLGMDKVRAREAGLLGVLPVTIGIDSSLARRGTRHRLTEVGLLPLVQMMEREHLRGAPRNEIVRRNLGISALAGQPVYGVERTMPRDPGRGFYAHRSVHRSDYLRALEVEIEVFGFDEQLDERYTYRDIDTAARLGDEEFDPSNRAYRL
jgi:hypothetical protein